MNDRADGFRHLGDRLEFRGKVWDVVTGSFETPDGEEFEREIVRSAGAVATVPITFADDDPARTRPLVTMIVQYRPAFDELVIEVPAGLRDIDGEDDAENARRELAEEVGLTAATIEHLCTTYQSPGMSDSTIAIYLADDCTPVARQPIGPEEVFSEVVTMPLADALGAVDDGRIRNGATVIGILMAARRLGIA